MEDIIKDAGQLPYHLVLNDMNITDEVTQIEFVDTTLMFAQNCNGIAKNNMYPIGQRMDGHFNWRTIAPARFFKVHFSYYHSEELIFVIRGWEEQELFDYMVTLDNQDVVVKEIINPSSELVKNIQNKDNN